MAFKTHQQGSDDAGHRDGWEPSKGDGMQSVDASSCDYAAASSRVLTREAVVGPGTDAVLGLAASSEQ